MESVSTNKENTAANAWKDTKETAQLARVTDLDKVRYRCQKPISLTLRMQGKIGYHNNDGNTHGFVSSVFSPECLSRNPCQFFLSMFPQRCDKARNSSTSYRCLEWYHSIVYLLFRGRIFHRNARLRRPFCFLWITSNSLLWEWIMLNYPEITNQSDCLKYQNHWVFSQHLSGNCCWTNNGCSLAGCLAF